MLNHYPPILKLFFFTPNPSQTIFLSPTPKTFQPSPPNYLSLSPQIVLTLGRRASNLDLIVTVAIVLGIVIFGDAHIIKYCS